jgi:acylphosphatase
MSEPNNMDGTDALSVVSRILLITGRVQGVGFRVCLAEEAVRAGLVGWVRNLDDGRVEALLQGPLSDVEKIEGWCHHGPNLARVQSVETSEARLSSYTDFVITD